MCRAGSVSAHWFGAFYDGYMFRYDGNRAWIETLECVGDQETDCRLTEVLADHADGRVFSICSE